MADLQETLDQALSEGNSEALTIVYLRAAAEKEAQGHIDAACFLLTHAFVHALESGSDLSQTINQRLVGHGREVPLGD